MATRLLPLGFVGAVLYAMGLAAVGGLLLAVWFVPTLVAFCRD